MCIYSLHPCYKDICVYSTCMSSNYFIIVTNGTKIERIMIQYFIFSNKITSFELLRIRLLSC